MKTRMILKVAVLGLILSVFAGCVPTKEAKPVLTADGQEELRLNFSPLQETNYKVITQSAKDYSFLQPSIDKTKQRHTNWRTEIVFAQKIETVDRQAARADITIKKLKYLSQDAEGKLLDFDSTTEAGKSDSLFALIGQSYKIKITPDGKVEVIDANAARQAVEGEGLGRKVAERLLSDEEIVRRHQVGALNDAGEKPLKVGGKWSTLSPSPAGMFRPKTFEKIYALTDIKKEDGGNIATITMEGVPSSKNISDASEKNTAAGFFASMFDEKEVYNGKMVINLAAGEIENYQELLKVEWLAIEPLKEKDKESDKTPDQLTMSFTNLYSIEKVNSEQ